MQQSIKGSNAKTEEKILVKTVKEGNGENPGNNVINGRQCNVRLLFCCCLVKKKMSLVLAFRCIILHDNIHRSSRQVVPYRCVTLNLSIFYSLTVII